MPRARFTVGRMMLAVAVVGVALGVGGCWQRRQSYLRRAEDCRMTEMMRTLSARDLSLDPPRIAGASYRDQLPDGTSIRVEGLGPGRRVYIPAGSKIAADEATIAAAIKAFRREATRMARLRGQYERAARAPWLPVAIDPPGTE